MTEEILTRLQAEFRAEGFTANMRESAAANGMELYVPVELLDGASYTLGWFVEPGGRRVRRLLDYYGWIKVEPTVDSILAAIEASEYKRTRRTWPAQAKYHSVKVIREVKP